MPGDVERAVTTAGVIGLGDIGKGVADSLVRAGIDLVVCDVRPDAVAPYAETAAVAGSPAELGARADVVLVAVVNDAQVRAVVDGPEGALGAMQGGAVIVLATVAPVTVEALAEAAAVRGVDVLDCAVSGGPEASAAGSLVAMVGGDESAIERVRPVLDAFTGVIVHMGPVGAGLKAKLARNLVQYGSWLAAYEAQVLAEAAGIELSKLALVIRESDKFIGGSSRLMFRDTVAPLPVGTDPGYVAAMAAGASLAHKDLRAAMELGREVGVDLPLAAMTDDRCDDVFAIRLHPDALEQSKDRGMSASDERHIRPELRRERP